MQRLRSLYINIPALQPGTPGGYALAFVCAGVATVLRLAVDPYVDGVPFITFWPAVITTVLISGFGAGLFCVVLSTVAADFFVIRPRLSFYIASPVDAADLLLFVVLASFCVVIVSQMRDAIEREQAERALRQSKERLQLALDAARLGWWQYDPLYRVVSGDTRFKEIVDVAENEASITEIMERANPNDMGKVWAAFNAVHDSAETKRSPIEFQLRGDGEIRWVETLALPHFDGIGGERGAAGVVGTVADITERKHHEGLLQRQADLLDQSHDAIFMWKIGGGITYWSRGAEELYGYTAQEAIGRISHELLQTRSSISMHEVEAQIAREGSWQGELTHTTRDGSVIVVESHHVRISYDGETFALETNRDITERKRHEEREHLLMREMNHRAKNTLGLVQAIARQTATRDPEDFIERFSERIQSLSANQELLFRNEWKGVEVGSLVRAQLAHFADLIGSRIAVQGPVLRLKAVGAQAIGMALHELATNAGKYGALSRETGRVNIRWQTDDDTFTMGWVERDGPPVSAPTRRGFGTIVMEEMTERSLDGTVALDYAPSGVTWRLTCPAVKALEPTA